ncbi:MAG: single-stranded-DNA-specific exonuclease RecJ [Pontiellaceae bacterium]|jgi:single-stranded-DNA-specific exonuclease|nr:single-stranded-DNA-specific exonuclease RecJ [Pontiellaceae bacterium]
MSKLWKFKPCDEVLAGRFFREMENLPKPLAALLVQRGCKTVEEAGLFLNPALSTLRDPFELPDMDKAVVRIRRALSGDEKITVFGDYDVDGVCSTALLVRVLRELGGDVSAVIPSRFDDGYGLSADALTACITEHHPSLIVTVDCGTGSVEAVEKAGAAGVDVVITDHHEPGGQIAPAAAVVNPKCVEGHPARILAGAGVAFKLCHALIKTGRDNGCLASASVDLKKYLDFVAVATVADLVPLLGENRALVRAGFQSLENSCRAGWNALKKLAGITGAIETHHAGFAFGPRINAAGRIGHPDAALELLLTDLPARADELAQLLDQANRERQAIEKEMVREAIEEIDSYFDGTKNFGLVIAREGWHTGVIGIVASRLVARYGRPVAVIGMDGQTGRGSCRSIDTCNILDGLEACAGLLTRFGGHAMAAGLDIEEPDLDAFKALFNEAVAGQIRNRDLQPVLEIDRVITLADADELLMNGIRRAGPFGQDNPEPVWAVFGVNVADSRILKEKHLKLALSDGAVRREAIGFNLAEKLPSGPVDLAFTLQENDWNGRTTIQLNLRDLRPAHSPL